MAKHFTAVFTSDTRIVLQHETGVRIALDRPVRNGSGLTLSHLCKDHAADEALDASSQLRLCKGCSRLPITLWGKGQVSADSLEAAADWFETRVRQRRDVLAAVLYASDFTDELRKRVMTFRAADLRAAERERRRRRKDLKAKGYSKREASTRINLDEHLKRVFDRA